MRWIRRYLYDVAVFSTLAVLVAFLMAPSSVKTYGALELSNTWSAQQIFQGGFSVTGGKAALLVAGDCTVTACNATGQSCVSGTGFYLCNPGTGFYVSVTAAASTATVLTLTPLASVPATCNPGQVFHLTNGAFCHCYALNLLENLGSQGACQ